MSAQPDHDSLVPAFAPVPVRARRDGWSAARQRAFIAALAETGCVVTAARGTGMDPRGAYRLAARPDGAAFAAAWDQAAILAARRLLAHAFEYATYGVTETVTNKDGEIVAERRRPSERVLLYLLGHLNTDRFRPKGAESRPLFRTATDDERARILMDDLAGSFADVADDVPLRLSGDAEDADDEDEGA